MRQFRMVFGSSTESVAAVLAAFFCGIAIGSLAGAKLSRRNRPVRHYALAEMAIGLCALVIMPLLALYNAIYPDIYTWLAGHAGAMSVVRVILALVAMGPATIAMGITFPLVACAVVRDRRHVARRTGLLYALKILGAVVGAALAGFYLPIAIGSTLSIYLAVSINLLIGMAAIFVKEVDSQNAREASPINEEKAPRQWPRFVPVVLLVAAVSGFGTLSLEVLYTRLLSQHTERSVYSFAMMLVVFLICLAGGSAVVSRWLDRRDPWRFLAWTQMLAAGLVLAAPLVFAVAPLIASLGGSQVVEESFSRYLVRFALLSGIVLGPSVVLVGVVLPTSWKLIGQSDSRVGPAIGVLTALNTLAALAGSLMTRFVLLPQMGLGGSTLIVASLYAFLALIAFFLGYRGFRRWFGCASALSIVVLWYWLGLWQINTQPLAAGEKLLSYHDGAVATVAVIEGNRGQRTLKMNHTCTLGATAVAVAEIRQGRVPLLLHPRPKRVAIIGVATGITASAVLDFPVERVVAMELVPGVVDVLPYFDRWNRSFYTDPRVELVVADGRNHLLGSKERFDVIISDLFVPWRAGVGDLYTVEHFEVCRQRLSSGGIFAQWLPGFQLTVEQLRTITASMLHVFPVVTLWRNDFDAKRPILGLLAYRDEIVMDTAKTRSECERLAQLPSRPAPLISDPTGLQMLYVCDDASLRAWAGGARLNTDNHPVIEYETPRSLYEHRQRKVAPMLEFLVGLRPRQWCYDGSLAKDRSLASVFRAADLLHDASVAGSMNNFEREYRTLVQLAQEAGEVNAVAAYIVNVANRYRGRKMTDRSYELLSRLVAQPKPPVAALLALVNVRRGSGDEAEVVSLLERLVDQFPKSQAVRRELVELLKSTEQYERAVPHLEYLLDTDPDDPYLRLDLAHVFHRQGKSPEASQQIDEFKQRWDGKDSKAVWRYLRNRDLGSYIDDAGPAPLPASTDTEFPKVPMNDENQTTP